jgi:hypothetical protein
MICSSVNRECFILSVSQSNGLYQIFGGSFGSQFTMQTTPIAPLAKNRAMSWLTVSGVM